MNNWLLFALISFIVYIPSFNASGSYSSSSSVGRRRGGGGKGGNGGKGGSGSDYSKVDSGPKGGKGGDYGSDTKADKDYRDIIDYISKEIGKDDYTKDKGNDGSSYPQRRRDDDKKGGGLYDDLLWKVVEQGETITELKHKAKKCEDVLDRVDALEQSLECTSNIPPSLGVNVYICTSGGGGRVFAASFDAPLAEEPELEEELDELAAEAETADRRRLGIARPVSPPCIVGEIVILPGKPTYYQQQFLEPANGCEITDYGLGYYGSASYRPSVCQILYPIFGNDDTYRRRLGGYSGPTTCRTPDLSGKYLVGADSNSYKSKPSKGGPYYGRRNLGSYSPPYSNYPSFDYFPPKVGECIGSEFLKVPEQCPLKPERRYPPKPQSPIYQSV